MYGKAFESMYEGSMVGAGINVFAVWNYAIAKARRGVVELNPTLMAFVLGGKEKEVEEAIEFLCRPDDHSRSKAEGGRRLIREGEFQYRMVNWQRYHLMRDEIARRESNRLAKRRERASKNTGLPLRGEEKFCAMVGAGEDVSLEPGNKIQV